MKNRIEVCEDELTQQDSKNRKYRSQFEQIKKQKTELEKKTIEQSILLKEHSKQINSKNPQLSGAEQSELDKSAPRKNTLAKFENGLDNFTSQTKKLEGY